MWELDLVIDRCIILESGPYLVRHYLATFKGRAAWSKILRCGWSIILELLRVIELGVRSGPWLVIHLGTFKSCTAWS